MSETTSKPDFVPTASIIAFTFIGVMVFVGVIGRCLASNHSTIRGTQNSDLMIYQTAPKQPQGPRVRRNSRDRIVDGNGDSQTTLGVPSDTVELSPVHRGHKKF